MVQFMEAAKSAIAHKGLIVPIRLCILSKRQKVLSLIKV